MYSENSLRHSKTQRLTMNVASIEIITKLCVISYKCSMFGRTMEMITFLLLFSNTNNNYDYSIIIVTVTK